MPSRPSLGILATALGAALGGVLNVLNTITSMKLAVARGWAPLPAVLGGLLLAALRIRDRHANALFASAAAQGALVTHAIGVGWLAARLSFPSGTASWSWVAGISMACTVVGIGLAWLLRESYLVRENLPFPYGTATGRAIESFQGERAKTAMLLGAALSFALTVLGVSRVGPARLPGLPSFLTPNLSLIELAMGYMVGARMAVPVALGAAYSAVAWALGSHGGSIDFSRHILKPEVLSVGVALIVASALVSMRGLVNRSVIPGFGRLAKPRPPVAAVGLLLLVLVGTAIALSVRDSPSHSTTGWNDAVRVGGFSLAVLAWLPVASAIASRSGGETGMVPTMALGLVAMALAAPFSVGAPRILASAAIATAVAGACFTMMNTFKAGAIVGVEPRDLSWAAMTGAGVGAAGGALFLVRLTDGQALPSAEYPVPTSVAWSATAQSLQHGSLPPGIAWPWLLPALALGGVASWLGLPVSALGIGVLISPSAAVSMLAGGLIQRGTKVWRRRQPGARRYAQTIEDLVTGLLLGVAAGALVSTLRGR